MSAFKKLQNLSAQEEVQATGVNKNPYTNAKASKYNAPPEGTKSKEDYLLSKIYELERVIKDLKQDIATFYSMTLGDEESQQEVTATQARELYSDFRAHPGHLANRIIDKINLKTGASNV